MPRLLLALACLLAAVAATPTSLAHAQEDTALSATVIVSDLGTGAQRGRLERRVAEAWAARRRALGGVFGQEVALEVRSDASDPARAARLASEAIAAGVHALVCCTTPAATARVAPLAAAAGVPLLSPTASLRDGAEGWQFVLAPSRRTHLQAAVQDMYRRGVTGIGVLAPEGPLGDALERDLKQLIAVESMRVVADVRYGIDADVLTPEALQVATREPGAILAWGLRRDVVLAVEGLRARGWTGPVYVPGALLEPLAGGLPRGLSGEVRVAVAPAVVPTAIDAADPRSSWIADARALGGGSVGSEPYAADGAVMHDALVLLGMAFERASLYGVAADDVQRYRLGLRDALVSLGPVHLAAGSYDPRMDRVEATLAEGLVAAHLQGGRPVPLP